jgi:hypothetical protein
MGKLVKITSLVGAFLATFSAVLHFIIWPNTTVRSLPGM